MKRIAILGGGLSGLTAAYELTRPGNTPVDIVLFESSGRLGGTVETVRRDGFTIECGPDGWVSEKPWARELAVELGLASELLPSLDRDRKTHILQQHRLVAMPDGMRMIVPTDLDTLDRSTLFSPAALAAYRSEPRRAAELRARAPQQDESVAAFTRRHFGSEVLRTIAAPLLSGVFGGDVRRLSVRAVMAPFVAIEQEHGSLIRGFQLREAARRQSGRTPISLFTTLRDGLGTLTDALAAQLPPSSVRLGCRVTALERRAGRWAVYAVPSSAAQAYTAPSGDLFDDVIVALPLTHTHDLVQQLDPRAAALLPTHASSAVIVALAWPDARLAPGSGPPRSLGPPQDFAPPPGFGFLVPPARGLRALMAPRLLATTFVEQKFLHRVPPSGRLLRAFFGGIAARSLRRASDHDVVRLALRELTAILGPLPAAAPLTVVRRWPGSLPQYEVGHLNRIARLEQHLQHLPGFHLLGNALHGVGLPDLIRDARALARSLRQP